MKISNLSSSHLVNFVFALQLRRSFFSILTELFGFFFSRNKCSVEFVTSRTSKSGLCKVGGKKTNNNHSACCVILCWDCFFANHTESCHVVSTMAVESQGPRFESSCRQCLLFISVNRSQLHSINVAHLLRWKKNGRRAIFRLSFLNWLMFTKVGFGELNGVHCDNSLPDLTCWDLMWLHCASTLKLVVVCSWCFGPYR